MASRAHLQLAVCCVVMWDGTEDGTSTVQRIDVFCSQGEGKKIAPRDLLSIPEMRLYNDGPVLVQLAAMGRLPVESLWHRRHLPKFFLR